MIELNADIARGCDDASLMPYLARVSVACGGHTGDAVSMAGRSGWPRSMASRWARTRAIQTEPGSAGGRLR